jgi:hypothetical protein
LFPQIDNSMAVEDLSGSMWWKIPTGSALNRYANPAVFEILPIACATSVDTLGD